MDAVELRPLTLGEILDRTFTMYRRHFLFFVTLAGIFQVPSLALALLDAPNAASSSLSVSRGITLLFSYCVAFFGYILANGGAALAISEFYLGHTITISQALTRVLGRFWALFGAAMVSGFVIVVGFICLIIPGFYVICRQLVLTQAVILDRKGPTRAFSRSWELTQGFAGRAFVIVILYYIISIAVGAAIALPLVYSIREAASDPSRLRVIVSIQAFISTLASVLLLPILQIACSVFYFDLRVRKEAFDLQFMMNPDAPADDSRFLTEA